MRTARRRRVLSLIVLVALLASSCGGESTQTTDSTPPSSADPGTTAGPGDDGAREPEDAAGDATDEAPETSTTTTVVEEDPASETSGPPPIPPATEFQTGVRPSRIVIPSIDVDATVIDLDIRGSAPEVPSDFSEVGWYEQTRLPGEIGPAVLAGHIDSESGPAVFFRLNELEPGDELEIHSADGEVRVFEVLDSGQYPKENLPREVFGFDMPVAELRLITCGGTFDRRSGHYQDNFVVYTREVGALD